MTSVFTVKPLNCTKSAAERIKALTVWSKLYQNTGSSKIVNNVFTDSLFYSMYKCDIDYLMWQYVLYVLFSRP